MHIIAFHAIDKEALVHISYVGCWVLINSYCLKVTAIKTAHVHLHRKWLAQLMIFFFFLWMFCQMNQEFLIKEESHNSSQLPRYIKCISKKSTCPNDVALLNQAGPFRASQNLKLLNSSLAHGGTKPPVFEIPMQMCFFLYSASLIESNWVKRSSTDISYLEYHLSQH